MPPFTQDILLTAFDLRRLEGLLQVLRERSAVDAQNLDLLSRELARAHVVEPERIPSDVVTMNSRVVLLDLESGARTELSLVFPGSRSRDDSHVPVLSPLGLALLGCRRGDVMVWSIADGPRRLRIESVIYQPEAAGEYFI